MTAFRVEASLGALVLALLPATGLAQAGPRQLTPPAVEQPPADPAEPSAGPVSPGTPGTGMTETGPVQPGAPLPPLQAPTQSIGQKPGTLGTERSPTIEMGTLSQVDPSSAGALPEGVQALPADLWAGLPRGEAERLLNQTPPSPPSLAMQDLKARLLLSPATPPAGAGEPWLAVRLDRLIEAGFTREASDLANRVQALADDEAVQRLGAEATLLAMPAEEACQRMTRRFESADPFWMRIRLFCYAAGGEADAARLTQTLLAQTAPDAHPVLDAAVAKLVEGMDLPVPADFPADALSLAALDAARLPVPDAVADAATLDRFAAIARNDATAAPIRVVTAERAARAGLVGLDVLASAYGALAFTPDELADAWSTAEADPSPRANAALWQAAQLATTPDEKVARISDALAMADRLGVFPLIARLHADGLAAIPPSGLYGAAAPQFARALLSAGRPMESGAWAALIDPAADGTALARDWLSVAQGLSTEDRQVAAAGAEALDRVEDAIDRDDPFYRRVAAAAAAYAALGIGGPGPELIGEDLVLQDEYLPFREEREMLALASAQGRAGETALRALSTIGARGPARAHATGLGAAVAALVRVNLGGDARALAREAVLGAAPPGF